MNVLKYIPKIIRKNQNSTPIEIKVGVSNLLNRENWLLQKLLDIPKGWKILDAGAGELYYKKYCNHLNYISQDFGKYDGKGNKKGLQSESWDNSRLDIVSDIASIPSSDASFDAIMCIEVLEHLVNPVSALKEFARLLRRGGRLILTAPFCSLTHFAPYHFSTGFNCYFYEKHLPELEFKIIEIIPNGNYFEYLAQEIQRIPQIVEKYSSEKIAPGDPNTIFYMLNLLERLSSGDHGSSELLCYGYHVLAERI